MKKTIKRRTGKRSSQVMKFITVFLLVLVFTFSHFVSFLPHGLQNNKLAESLKVKEARAAVKSFYFQQDVSPLAGSWIMFDGIVPDAASVTTSIAQSPAAANHTIIKPGVTSTTTGTPGTVPNGFGWFSNAGMTGTFASGAWTFRVRKADNRASVVGHPVFQVFRVPQNTSLTGAVRLFSFDATATDWWTGATASITYTSTAVGPFSLANEYLYIEVWDHETSVNVGKILNFIVEGSELADTDRTKVTTPDFAVPATTTLGDGTDPGNSTIAPSAAITDLDAFTLATNTGTDSVTALTVTLTGASSFESLSEVRITSDNGATLYFAAVANPASNTVSFSAGTPLPVSTTATQFKVRITPKTHASMPVPPGLSYTVGGTVTAFTSTNAQAGSDATTPAAIAIDNLSPGNATATSGTAGNAQVTLNYTTPADTDLNSVVILRNTVAITATPTEGATYIAGDPVGADAVGCIDATIAASTADSCIATGLTNGTAYHFKIFVKDANGNYSATGVVPTGSPFTPTAPAVVVTASFTGTQAVNLDSGATAQYIGAAFSFQQDSGTADTITGLTISETGTVVADVNLDGANTGIRWESAVATCTFNGTETFIAGNFTLADQLIFSAISIPATLSPNFTCVYLVVDIGSGATGGQTIEPQITAVADFTLSGASTKALSSTPAALTGTTTVRPNVTSVTYPNVGQSGGKVGQTVTLAGAGFGATCSVAGGNKVSIGIYDLSCTGATFTATSISIAVDSGIPAANDGGTGANGLLVTIGSTVDDARQTYYVLPAITGIIDDFGGVDDTAREFSAGDTAANNATADLKDGEIQIDGNHFGASGTVTILGQSATPVIVGARCGGSSWTTTCIVVQVPTTIPDGAGGIADYVGNIAVSRTDTKNDALTGFRVLPRIIANNLNNGVANDKIQITGNHLCQSGTCPVSPNRSVAADNIKFGATQAVDAANGDDFFNAGGSPCGVLTQAWNHTEICVAVPAGAPTGSQPTQATSNTSYTSNTQAFTVNSSVPNNPNVAGARQYKSDNTTVIGAGGITNESTVILKADISASIAINMALQVEIKPTGAAFACGAGACADAVEGTVVGGGACTGCTSLVNARVTVSGLSEGQKHWQARVRNTTTNEYSSWVSFGTDPDSVFEIDFIADTTAPTITFTPTNTCAGGQSGLSTNGITINWNINELADGQVEYGTDSNLVGSTNYPASPAAAALTHAIALSNLNSGTIYYYKVKSRDNATNLASNPSVSPYCQFTTTSVTQGPAKTASFHIAGATGPISGLTSYPFTVVLPENATSTQNAFVEITGISAAVASPTLGVSVNNQPARNYAIPASATTHFKILYRVTPVLISNTLNITPTNTTISITSARLTMTYAYTP